MPTAGPNFPTTTTGTTTTVGGGTRAWTSPSNANAADGVFTVCSLLASTATDDLNAQGFGFAITGTDTINGITVEVNMKGSVGANSTDATVVLLKAGASAGTNQGNGGGISTTATTIVYGGAANLWGTTWTPAQINASNFGFVWTGNNSLGGLSESLSIDFIRITITSTSASGGTNTAKMLVMF